MSFLELGSDIASVFLTRNIALFWGKIMTSVQTNIGALVAQRGMDDSMRDLTSAMGRLSSGYRINSAADDAAGSAIASKMDAQTRSLGVAIRNANDAVSMTQTAEGALGEVENILQRLRELTVQAGNSTLNDSDRAQIQAEVDQLTAEIDSIADKTNFNGNALLNGTNSSVSFQVGVDAVDQLSVVLQKTDSAALNLEGQAGTSTLISERVAANAATIAQADVKLNGFDLLAQDLTAITSTQTSGVASQMATAINANSGVHGAYANAFNRLDSNDVGPWAMSNSVSINGITITVKTSLSAFVDAVNEEVADVTATENADGTFTLFNDSGDPLTIGNDGGEASIGLTANTTFQGFLEITNLDGSAVVIEAGSDENGYGNSADGLNEDVQAFGFNEGNGSTIVSGAVNTTAILASDQIKINGVDLAPTDPLANASSSAKVKAEAINAISAQTGVTATASTEINVTVSSTYTGLTSHTVQGVVVNASGVTSLAAYATLVNSSMATAGSDVRVTVNSAGNAIFTSTSGEDIAIDDTDGAFFTAAVDGQGSEVSLTAGAGTAKGTLALTSADGSIIQITDGTTANTGVAKLGLSEQSEFASSSETGLSVSSAADAAASLTAIDAAITTVSEFRASFGAYENRLDSIVSNLTTYKTNLEASKGRIMDADFAAETSNLTKAQILQQAATSMLAQANASKQGLLALLQG